MMQRIEMIYMNIENLLAYENNVKLHPQTQIDKIASSIEKYGFDQPIAVDINNIIIKGHGRLLAAKQLGMTEVPVIVRNDLTLTQAAASRIADNKVSESPWDENLLPIELSMLKDNGIDINEDIGFTSDEISEIFKNAEIKTEENNEEDDEIPDMPYTPVSKPGDVWVLGNHRVMCGDSNIIDDVEKLMNGEKADMVFTDPPYELETKGGGILKNSTAMQKIKNLKIDKFDPELLVLHAKTNIFFCNKPLIPSYIDLAKKCNVSWDIAVYHKQNITPNYGGHMMTDIEYIFIIGEQSPLTGLGYEKEIYSKLFSGNKDVDNETPWSKPVALCEKFIKIYSKSSVFDLFGGSGSTLIACEKIGRNCFMMEIAPAYVDIIVKRWEKYTGKKAVLESTGEEFKEASNA